MNPRLAVAVSAGRLTSAATRALRRGGGTALPGLVAESIDPRVAAGLGSQLGVGSVLITGTNGKTTASRLLASICAAARQPVVYNREGSNMMRGVSAALVASSSPSGRVRHGSRRLGLFETDEASLPAVAEALQPRAVAFTNLFRDQLDRYGEVDSVLALWREALAAMPPDATLVLNADDPSVAQLQLDWPGPVHWYGIDDPALHTDEPGAHDARWCRACGATFAYDRRYFAHVGYWRCTGCDQRRPEPDTVARDIALTVDSASFTVPGLGGVTLNVTGVYNVANALAAISIARVLYLHPDAMLAGLAAGQAAFGRQELVELEGRRFRLMLCKNPAGANQVLRLLATIPGRHRVAFLLNDRFADGQDVSWIWDVDFEMLAGRVETAWAGGGRAADAALRLKYAGWPPAGAYTTPAALIDAVLADTPPDVDVILVPTYTAMLDVRAELVRRGAAAAFWQA